jgi:hypothetical protein
MNSCLFRFIYRVMYTFIKNDPVFGHSIACKSELVTYCKILARTLDFVVVYKVYEDS